jgi:hypothetical protein
MAHFWAQQTALDSRGGRPQALAPRVSEHCGRESLPPLQGAQGDITATTPSTAERCPVRTRAPQEWSWALRVGAPASRDASLHPRPQSCARLQQIAPLHRLVPTLLPHADAPVTENCIKCGEQRLPRGRRSEERQRPPHSRVSRSKGELALPPLWRGSLRHSPIGCSDNGVNANAARRPHSSLPEAMLNGTSMRALNDGGGWLHAVIA